jgi:UDP-N-acetylmuramoylalanine--D-glutamate ligase
VRPPTPPGPYLVVGLARSGRAVARALHARGARVTAYDAHETEPVEGVELITGGDGIALLDRVACVVKSPGVPREAPVIAGAIARGIPVLGELELAWRGLPNELIAVTGTNGKTTTTELIGEIHRAAGLEFEVAGNIGRALSSIEHSLLSPRATIVCEVSSFQLEDTLAFAPDAAVLLNLTADHLDRHHSFERYREAKLRVFAHQPPGALAVLPEELAELHAGSARRLLFGVGERCALRLHDGWLHWEGEQLLATDELRMRAPLEDAMAAAAVALGRGVPREAVQAALVSFRGVAHRLEEIATVDGVTYVNDSKATNVASTLVALGAFEPGSILLILGGQGKAQDFRPLRDAIAERVAHTYLIGQDAPVIAEALAGFDYTELDTLEEAFARAKARARRGQVILLSPACASFDQFNSFEARGDAFRSLVLGQA